MKKIEAQTLEAAYAEASKHFECSVTELDIVIVQQPKKGFLGLMSKSAVIVARPITLEETEEETAETVPVTAAEKAAVEVPEAAAETYPEDDESEYEEVYADESYYTESAERSLTKWKQSSMCSSRPSVSISTPSGFPFTMTIPCSWSSTERMRLC